MPWRGPEHPGEFPTLGYQVADLIESACAIPDGDYAGEPYLLTDEMVRFLLWFYRIDPNARRDRGGRWRSAWVFDRGAQLVRPQKWGKGPFGSAWICAEAHPEGPVRFDGWDANGEPVGRPVPTPWIQVTAVAEDQTDNVWDALVPMIELGALSSAIYDTGRTRINLPGGGKIEPVSSSAATRLGQRITGALQDQTESWTAHNGGRKVADTQRRNLAGMGGRFFETANAWDPAEDSVAQQTAQGDEHGVHRDDIEPGTGSIRNKADRRRMLRKVYGDSWWVDIDRIDSEIVALLPRDAAQAERWFLNRKEASEAAAFDPEQWTRLAHRKYEVPRAARITIGVDGARFVDALAIVATEVVTGYQWPIGIWERPESAAHDYEHPPDEVDGAMSDAFERFDVWRVYIDPQYIEDWVDRWRGRWGEKRVIVWRTNRPSQIVWPVRRYVEAVGGVQDDGRELRGDLTHDGDPTLARHIKNARKQKLSVKDDKGRQMFTLAKESRDSAHKMDGAMAAVLAWEARGDCIAAGETERQPSVVQFM